MITASNEFGRNIIKKLFDLAVKMCIILITISKSNCASELLPEEKTMYTNLKMQKMCNSLTILNQCPNCNITFWLFNRDITEQGYEIHEDVKHSFRKAPFLAKVPIKILVHGYAGNKLATPNTELTKEYVKRGYNIISMDYGPVVRYPCHFQSVRNLEVVGKCLAHFIKILLRKKIKGRGGKVKISDLHLLGFGIGAQVAAKAAEIIKRTTGPLPRVTALDPSLPLFYGAKPFISPQVADFVDVIHTSTVLYPYLAPCGHIDYFVNTAICQGECTVTVSCTRGMSAVYYAESINSDVQFCGFDLFVSENKPVMGEKAIKNVTGCFGVFTNTAPPYARGCHEDDCLN